MTKGNEFFNYESFETDRVILKILTLQDTEEVFKYFSNPKITEFMDIEPCKTREEAKEIITYHLEDTGCRWGLYDKENNEFIGTCGFHYLRKTSDGTIAEIGFDLSPSYWGKGLMEEVMTAVIQYGFNKVGFYMLDATVEPDNILSLKLMERLNFKRESVLKENLVYFTLLK
ncbi:GNAT family N-acetyltransferase [Bacillus sp. JJ1562]|uniref:GNAT family N-acetyltransferase n=1 Tax=Bacillus sp. JJ1562 TaxID=3122960 RepID=UPI0030017E6C